MPLDLKSRSPATQRSHPWTSGSAGEKPWGYAASSWSPAPFLHTCRCSWGPAPSLHMSCYSWGPAPSLHTCLSTERMLAQTDASGRVEHPHSITHRESAIPHLPHGPLQPAGRPHRGLGFSPDLASAITNRPLGRQRGLHPSIRVVAPSLPPRGRHSTQACPDPSWSQADAEATRWAGRLWDLGPRLPSLADLNPGCQELGTVASWNSGQSWHQQEPRRAPSQPLVVSVRHTQTHMYTYPHMAQMHAHTPGAFQALHQSSRQRWTPLTRILAQTGAPSPPPLGPQALVHVASPPPHAVPSSSRLLVALGPTEEEHPFPEPRFPLSLTRAFLCTTGCISASFPEQCCLCTNSPEPQAGPGGCILGH